MYPGCPESLFMLSATIKYLTAILFCKLNVCSSQTSDEEYEAQILTRSDMNIMAWCMICVIDLKQEGLNTGAVHVPLFFYTCNAPNYCSVLLREKLTVPDRLLAGFLKLVWEFLKYDYIKKQNSLYYPVCQGKGYEGKVHWDALLKDNPILYFQRAPHCMADVSRYWLSLMRTHSCTKFTNRGS